MACTVPIEASSELIQCFKDAAEKRIRFIKVRVEKRADKPTEQFVVASVVDSTGTMEQDFDTLLPGLLDDATPCYVIVRMDETGPVRVTASATSFFIYMWVPGNNPRAKMQYAAALESLKSELGGRLIDEVVHASDRDEISWASYTERHTPAPKPWSRTEEAVHTAHEAEAEARREITEDRQATSMRIGGYHSVSIPLDEDAEAALKELAAGNLGVVQLSISEDGKHIGCDSTVATQVPLSGLSEHIHPNLPRFIFYSGGARKFFFIYSCPDSSPIRMRMPYSTAKPGVLRDAESLGLKVAKSIEVRGPDDLAPDAFAEPNRAAAGVRATWAPGTGASRIQPKAGNVPAYLAWSGGGPSKGKKKIVMPPPGAYM